MNAPAPLLEVEHLTMRFGGLVAIDDLSFTAQQRQITAIIGPNGAGKTTVFNCLTGFYKPTVGQLTFHADGQAAAARADGRAFVSPAPGSRGPSRTSACSAR